MMFFGEKAAFEPERHLALEILMSAVPLNGDIY